MYRLEFFYICRCVIGDGLRAAMRWRTLVNCRRARRLSCRRKHCLSSPINVLDLPCPTGTRVTSKLSASSSVRSERRLLRRLKVYFSSEYHLTVLKCTTNHTGRQYYSMHDAVGDGRLRRRCRRLAFSLILPHSFHCVKT